MVGGSVAGSTAGWWPSDRDRFPPRFLLPPSLQTHNCIISTRPPLLPLSFVPPTRSPTHQPLSAQPSFSLFLCMFLHARSTATRAAVSLSSSPPHLLVCPFLHLLLQHTSSSTPYLLLVFFSFSLFSSSFSASLSVVLFWLLLLLS